MSTLPSSKLHRVQGKKNTDLYLGRNNTATCITNMCLSQLKNHPGAGILRRPASLVKSQQTRKDNPVLPLAEEEQIAVGVPVTLPSA